MIAELSQTNEDRSVETPEKMDRDGARQPEPAACCAVIPA
jgi:hypothetical protein